MGDDAGIVEDSEPHLARGVLVVGTTGLRALAEGDGTMTSAPETNVVRKRAVLFRLEPSLASSLEKELSKCGCQTESAAGPGTEDDAGKPDIVFCPSSRPMLRQAMTMYPRTPVVVVSRVPEVDDWLDALEEGAADYCAPPFETIQIRWLLETHAGERRSMAAA
jgi:DNA-binding NtrC family response regulator